MRRLLALVAFSLCLSSHVLAKDGGSRTEHRVGFTVGLFSDPFPNLVGAALRINVTDFFQLHVGYGNLSYTTTSGPGATTSLTSTALGAGGRFFIPGWSFSPFLGFNYSHWSATGNVTLGTQTINAGSGLPGVMYLTFGLDWQTHAGFNVGGGAHYILAPTQLSTAISVTPNIYIGWYF